MNSQYISSAMKNTIWFCFAITVMFAFCTGIARANSEAELHSLFMTVEERNSVDDKRSGHVVKKIKPKEKTEKIIVKGFVKRSDGKSVVWVNNKSTIKSDTISNVKVNSRSINKKNQVTLSVDGKRLKLKPGETWLSAPE